MTWWGSRKPTEIRRKKKEKEEKNYFSGVLVRGGYYVPESLFINLIARAVHWGTKRRQFVMTQYQTTLRQPGNSHTDRPKLVAA